MEDVMTNAVPDYRIAINWPVRSVLAAGGLSAMLGVYFLYERRSLLAAFFLILAGLGGLLRLMLFLISDPRRRAKIRDRMVNSVEWNGTEQVLDVGCGNGLVLMAAAKQLTGGSGKATGIDIWNEMAGRQNAEALRRNAEIEGVADRIEFQEADARMMPFGNGSFDVVLASLSLHHAGGKHGIEQVVREMKRVLKPGGVILLYDLFPATAVAARAMRELGIRDIEILNAGVLPVLRARSGTN